MSEAMKFSPRPHADDQRTVLAHAEQAVRILGADDAERVAALHLGDDLRDRLQDIAAVVVLEHLRDHFGVRFRNELDAAAHQMVFEVQVIFDDAVVHDGELAALARLRVRVDVARRAVRRPARVADAERAGDRLAALDQLAEHAQSALGLCHADAVLRKDRDARGIIPAVFELFSPSRRIGAA